MTQLPIRNEIIIELAMFFPSALVFSFRAIALSSKASYCLSPGLINFEGGGSGSILHLFLLSSFGKLISMVLSSTNSEDVSSGMVSSEVVGESNPLFVSAIIS